MDSGDAVPRPPDSGSDQDLPQELAALRREVTELVWRQTELTAAAHGSAIRRAGVDVLGPLAVAFALVAAVGLAIAAIVLAMATVLPAWAAALILAAVWVGIAGILALVIRQRAEAGKGTAWWRVLQMGDAGEVDETRAARDRAEQAARERLTYLAPRMSEQAVAIIVPIAAAAAARMASKVADEAVTVIEDVTVDVADDAVEIGRDLVAESEELAEDIAGEVPGAGVVSQIWGLALLPGRTGVRMVTTVLRRPPGEG